MFNAAAYGASTMTRDATASPTGTQSPGVVTKEFTQSVASRTPGVRLVRFSTPAAATPSEPPAVIYEGEVQGVGPSPMMSMLPWLLGTLAIGGSVYALSRRKK